MKQGDFSELAEHYHNRPGYSLTVLKMLGHHIQEELKESLQVVDVGAGTGKLTENLCECGYQCLAVEPNTQMREQGIKYTKQWNVKWQSGSGEDTKLPPSSAHWVLMGSSFHWVDTARGLREFQRILKPQGFFTAIWNPRDISKNQLHQEIESMIYDIAPEIKRKSSGGSKYTDDMEEKLLSTGHFTNPIFIESSYTLKLSKERYLGSWRSVNDIQAQAGPERFEKILRAISDRLVDFSEIDVPYKTRAWTVTRCD